MPTVLAYSPPYEVQKPSLDGLIEQYGDLYGADKGLARRIVSCESQNFQFAQNPRSTADGYFQFIDSTWYTTMDRMGLERDLSKFALPQSVQAGMWLLAEDGTRHWLESAYCWDI